MGIQEDIKQQSAFDSIHHEVIVNVLYTANWLDTLIKNLLQPFGITNIHFNILRILAGAKGEPLSAGQIKEVMVFKGSDVTRLIDRLVAKNLVERSICPTNRRKVNINISTEGAELLDQVNAAMKKFIDDTFAGKLSLEEAQALSQALNKLRQ